jgi:hypothetical protein
MWRPSQAAILWKDARPSSPAKTSRFNYDRTPEAQEISQFWSRHKMAVGVATAGVYGLAGGVVAIHFHPQWSVDLGYGGGSHFQSYGFRVKKQFLLSSPLNPYVAVGFHRWQRTTNRPFDGESVSPSYVANKFLSDADLQNSRIDERLLHGSLGLQYIFTQGEWASYGVYVEVNMLVSAIDLTTAPTGTLGFNYFF